LLSTPRTRRVPRLNRNPTILIAEDDPNYAVLLERALREKVRTSPIHILTNGREIVAYIQGTGKYQDRTSFPFPSVLFLDLEMPRMSGFEVLRWMHDRPDCRVIPTLVLSVSAGDADIEKAYQLGAQAFLTKPARFKDLKSMLSDAARFWGWCLKPEVPTHAF
jgi:CheY-like chemotaxis protein